VPLNVNQLPLNGTLTQKLSDQIPEADQRERRIPTSLLLYSSERRERARLRADVGEPLAMT